MENYQILERNTFATIPIKINYSPKSICEKFKLVLFEMND